MDCNSEQLYKSCITEGQKNLESMNDTLKEIKELLSLNLKYQENAGQKKYGPSRIRTGDLRRVKAVS